MARKRMIDPNIWDSPSFANLSILAMLVFIGMISNADDEGRGRANANYLKSKIFPYDTQIGAEEIGCALDEIAENISVTFYVYRSCEYYSFDRWKRWQRVDKPQPSLIIPYDQESCRLFRGGEYKTDSFRTDTADISGDKPAEDIHSIGEAVIGHLNAKAGTNFRSHANATLALIGSRLDEKYSADDLIRVIDKKTEDWMGSPMQKYLRPQTLFGEKFEGYLNQELSKPQKKSENSHEYDVREVEEHLFGLQACQGEQKR